MRSHLPILILLLAVPLLLAQNLNQYQVISTTQTSTSIVCILNYTGTNQYYELPTSPIVDLLNFTVIYDADNEVSITIDAVNSTRFKVPNAYPFSYNKHSLVDIPNYSVEFSSSPFSFSVVRNATGETLFNTTNFNFVYSNLFITFGTTLPTQYFYGWGERAMSFLYTSGLYTTWNKDQYCQIDSGQGNQQLYGTHPMYLMQEQSGNWHVVFLKNINAMDLQLDLQNLNAEFRLTGGIIHLKFFIGDTNPDTSIKLYHQYINGYTLMPFWAHGYHQSRWGMIYLQDMIDVLNNFTAYNIPLDVIWSDIDYMYTFTDFTVDNNRYNTTQFTEVAQSIHWVPIIDIGVSMNYTAPAYNVGTEMNVWITSVNNDSNPLIGVVWPGLVHWPDFWHPNATPYWHQMMKSFYQTVPFSGLWLDMNELSNFCQGEYPTWCFYLSDYLPPSDEAPTEVEIENEYIAKRIMGEEVKSSRKNTRKQQPKFTPKHGFEIESPYDYFPYINSSDLPYLPGGEALENHTLSVDALHYGNYQEFDVHNLNGFMECFNTYENLIAITGKRPFILSRSTYVGSGQFAIHWTGDNAAAWNFLQVSIPEILNFNLYGIPMTGADICGFAGNTTVELCARWMQLGAFYPFMRNHMALDSIPHFPYSLGPVVLEASLASLNLRYSILKYWYSLFVKARGSGAIFKPLFFEFANDTNLLSMDDQFLVGNELLVAPAINQGQTEVDVYFPGSTKWYDFLSGNVMQDVTSNATTVNYPAPLNGTAPVFLRGGYIVPMQSTVNVTKTDQLSNVFELVVGLVEISGNTSVANGQMLSIENYDNELNIILCTEKDCVLNIAVQAVTQTSGQVSVSLTFAPNAANTVIQTNYLSSVTLYGVRRQICEGEQSGCPPVDQVVVYPFSTGTLIAPGTITFTV